MGLPAWTGYGDAAFVTVNSAPAVVPTTVDAEAVLLAEFGSVTDELTVAVSVITVPLAVAAFTLVINVKVATVFAGMFKSVHTTLPVFPTPGVVQLHPAGAERETSVVLAGMASDRVALSAALGPLLVTTWV